MGKLKFDAQALYDAVDAQRRERGMTWADLSKELRISTSTIKSMTKRRFVRFNTAALYVSAECRARAASAICEWLGSTIDSFQHETMF